MPGRVLAMAHWRRLDGEGTDRCTLARADHGWLLTGQAHWQERRATASLLYTVRCDPDWTTRSVDITGERAGATVNLRILSGPAGWTMNGAAQPEAAGCTDIDLSFTPATNLLPLRRLPEGEEALPVHAAWLVPDLDRLTRLEQCYAPQADGTISYASPSCAATLEVHPSGFVTRYPGLWEGWVDG